MAINLDDFIFHSDYNVYGLLNTYKTTLKTNGGTIPANTSQTIYGDWVDVGSGRSFSVATWKKPALPQSAGGTNTDAGKIVKGSFVVRTTQPTGQQPMGIWFFPYADQQGGNVRAALQMFNNTGSAATIPTADWLMKISTYIVPPKLD